MAKPLSISRCVVNAGSLLALLFFCLPAKSADAVYAQAMSDFQARRYPAALAGFQKVAAANRADIPSHYYMALCYQSTNQLALASREYQWVATYSKDPALKSKAQAGAAQLSRYASSSSSTSPSTSNSNMNPFMAAMMGAGKSQQRKSEFSSGRMKVTEFYTQWCHVCRDFEPEFKQAQSNYSNKCDFKRLDAEDPSNRDLVEKYKVKNYPTTVMADSTGKPVKIFVGLTSAFGL